LGMLLRRLLGLRLAGNESVWVCNSISFKRPVHTTSISDTRRKKERVFQPKTYGFGFYDTHVHLNSVMAKRQLRLEDLSVLKQKEFGEDFIGCVSICCDARNFEVCEKIAKMFPSFVFSSFGIHPHNADQYNAEVEQRILDNMKLEKTVAWGECGLDYYRMFFPKEKQQDVFCRQMEMCLQTGKPLIVHTRDAEEDTLRLMKKIMPKNSRIHLHCFTGSSLFASQLLDHFDNLFFGFTGVITFMNSQLLSAVVQQVPLERILLETDGPYMAPAPYRGTVAHSGMIPLVAERVAELKKVPIEQVLQQTSSNAKKLYGL